MSRPPVSVVINTYNRAESLRVTLRSLRQLDYPNFEVVVVDGPSTDHTADVVREFEGSIKVAHCPNRNLSESRNIGIAQAAGDIVAFIDDDAYPDPAWLDRIVEGYQSEDVAAVGGPVYDHTGARLQARYSMANRFGIARVDVGTINPTEFFNSPQSLEFAYPIGTNSSFRREHLVAIGGFDEEFEYYLDETDVCVRLVDRGLLIRALDDGFVYHKFLSSEIRSPVRVVTHRYTILKNTCYFALKHGLRWGSFADVCERLGGFIEAQRGNVRHHLIHGDLTEADAERFELDVDRAFDDALRTHLTGRPTTSSHPLDAPPPFLPFPTLRPADRRLHVVFFSQEWPPARINGIARFVRSLATGLADAGHIVHVLTRGAEFDRVDLEDGVWVHRVVIQHHEPPTDIEVPQHIWDHSASLFDELQRIERGRHVDVVQVPNWDSEGLAVLLAGGFRTVVWLHTPLKVVRALDPSWALPNRQRDLLEQLEKVCYEKADAVLACGRTIVGEIEQRYGVAFGEERLGFVPHGMEDRPQDVTPITAAGTVEVLFVGRLEGRKGIDTLLACIPSLAAEFSDAHFTVVGDDSLREADGMTVRGRFEASVEGRALADRVRFLGPVDDSELLGRYAGCDVFVAPSRFESFGLILLEAMRFAKPVVACRVGGMAEVVEDGGNGFLVEAGDVEGLRAALAALIASPQLRAEFGERSRQLFEERYTIAAMVHGMNREYDRISGRSTHDDGATAAGEVSPPPALQVVSPPADDETDTAVVPPAAEVHGAVELVRRMV